MTYGAVSDVLHLHGYIPLAGHSTKNWGSPRRPSCCLFQSKGNHSSWQHQGDEVVLVDGHMWERAIIAVDVLDQDILPSLSGYLLYLGTCWKRMKWVRHAQDRCLKNVRLNYKADMA